MVPTGTETHEQAVVACAPRYLPLCNRHVSVLFTTAGLHAFDSPLLLHHMRRSAQQSLMACLGPLCPLWKLLSVLLLLSRRESGSKQSLNTPGTYSVTSTKCLVVSTTSRARTMLRCPAPSCASMLNSRRAMSSFHAGAPRGMNFKATMLCVSSSTPSHTSPSAPCVTKAHHQAAVQQWDRAGCMIQHVWGAWRGTRTAQC